MTVQSITRGEIRRSVGGNLGICIDGEATSTTDTTSLIDTVNLMGEDDEYNGRQVRIYDATGSIVDGETQLVSDYTASTSDATTAAFTAAITDGDKYEMWDKPWRINDIDKAIKQVELEVSSRCLQIKETETTYVEWDKSEYDCLTDFVKLGRVDYVYAYEGEVVNECTAAWTGATGVTVSLDSEIYRRNNSCVKLAVSDAVAAGALLAYVTIDTTDFSNYDTIELWIRSDVAQTAAELEFYLDDTAAIASAVDTMSFPALTIDTWTRVQLTLTNPELDTSIITIGIGQKAATDIGACNIWLDYVVALKARSRKYMELPEEYWEIVRGSTSYLKLLKKPPQDSLLRLTGYQLHTLMTADSSVSQIDPYWLINKVTADLMLNHSKSTSLDISNREDIGMARLAQARDSLSVITTSTGNVRDV